MIETNETPKNSQTEFVNKILGKNFLTCFGNHGFSKIHEKHKPSSASDFTNDVYKYLCAYIFIHSAVWRPVNIDFIYHFLDEEFKKTLKPKPSNEIPESSNFQSNNQVFSKTEEINNSLRWLVEKDILTWNKASNTFYLRSNILEDIKEHLNNPKETDILKNIKENSNKSKEKTASFKPPNKRSTNKSNHKPTNTTKNKNKTTSGKRKTSAVEGDEDYFPEESKKHFTKSNQKIRFSYGENTSSKRRKKEDNKKESKKTEASENTESTVANKTN